MKTNVNIILKPLSKNEVRGNLEALKRMSSEIPFDNWELENYLIDLPLKWESSLYAVKGSNDLVGFLISSRKGEFMHINRICVSAETQGTGLGKAMINNLMAFARNQSMSRLSLKVHATNSNAISWYQYLDFKVIETINHYVLMNKKIL